MVVDRVLVILLVAPITVKFHVKALCVVLHVTSSPGYLQHDIQQLLRREILSLHLHVHDIRPCMNAMHVIPFVLYNAFHSS